MVRSRYALDTLVGGDFLHCNGDQAFNAIKNWLHHLTQLIILIHLLLVYYIIKAQDKERLGLNNLALQHIDGLDKSI
jgi:hypothetical protein